MRRASKQPPKRYPPQPLIVERDAVSLADIRAPRADVALRIASRRRAARGPAPVVLVCKSALQMRDEYIDSRVETQCSLLFNEENGHTYMRRRPFLNWLNSNYCARGLVTIECARCRNNSRTSYDVRRPGEFVSSTADGEDGEETKWLCRTCDAITSTRCPLDARRQRCVTWNRSLSGLPSSKLRLRFRRICPALSVRLLYPAARRQIIRRIPCRFRE